jgi:DNA-binding IclR family transcriptional regulator
MARPALSATRAIAVLNHLAGNPQEGFTLTELADELQTNPASMHAVLATLSAHGYVVREERRKTYRLGHSVIAIGQAALEQHPAIELAREQTEVLAEELGLECLAGTPVGRELLTFAAAGRSDRLHTRPRAGQRFPFVPPLGILAAAYAEPAALEAWLAGLGPEASSADRDRYRQAAADVRALGYEIDLQTPTRQQIGLVLYELGRSPHEPALLAKLSELVKALAREPHQLLESDPDSDRLYAIDNIQAPIFDGNGRLVAGLTLLGFDDPLPARGLERYLNAITGAASRVTSVTGGRAPLPL